MPGIIVGGGRLGSFSARSPWTMREAAKHQLPLTVMSIHPSAVRSVTGIYRGLRSYLENSFDLELARRAVTGP